MPYIKKDSHGLYLRLDGLIFRPQYARGCEGYIGQSFGSSNLSSGDHVRDEQLEPSVACAIRFGEGVMVEMWFSHGSYFGAANRMLQSDEVWQPLETRTEPMLADPTTRRDPSMTAILRFGKQELRVDITELKTQAEEIGRILPPSIKALRNEKTNAALEGVWNFLHAILDAAEAEGF